jgi:ABC-type multidrug transport system fused ATPase/permease subunit
MLKAYADLNRSLSAQFVFCLLGTMLCVLFGAFSDVLVIYMLDAPTATLWAHQGITVKALAGDAILFAAPILATIPYAGAFVDDVKSGYLKQFLPRTTVSRYILGKEFACAISGFLTLALGILAGHIIVTLAVIPVETFSGKPVESQLGKLIGMMCLYGLAGSLFAMLGMLLSTVTMNNYMAYAAPFILYYVLIILQERYARDIFMLNPQNYMTLNGKWPFGGWSAAITIMVLLAGAMLGFYVIAQDHLRDDNARKSIRTLLPQRRIVLDRPFHPAKAQGIFREIRQIGSVVRYNFRMWRGNARVALTFALAFILCFLLSDKAASFAYDMETTMQAFEPFVWTFGDANSVLLISLLLVLLFVDMPFLGAGVPYYLIRMRRRTWLAGQTLYIALSTLLYIGFIFLATTIICMGNSFIGNMWSETAAILGYSGAGKAVALPALVKVLELSRPYQCASTILLLMLLYTLLMVFLMLFVNIRHGKSAGIAAAFGFSLFGFLLNPQLFKQLFKLPDELMYKANVAVGWLSPLNQATYHMHNFGYDLLPRLWQTYIIFGVAIVLLYALTLLALRRYNFHFAGVDE